MSGSAGGTPAVRRHRVLALALVLLGLAVAVGFSLHSLRSFRHMRYIQEQGLDREAPDLEAIRPWMTIRFIAVAYAVPEEFLYAELGIPFDRRESDRPLGRIRPTPEPGGTPPEPDFGGVLVERAKAAVRAYRADPVATGLRELRPWMSLRYIANTAGMPLDTLYAQSGLPSSLNPDKPLDLVAEEADFPGGTRALVETLARALGLSEGGRRP